MQTITIKGTEFVLVERREYDRLRAARGELVEALPYAMASMGDDLRRAREEAGLTQAELAKRLRRSQAMVSSAESGGMRVGERYVLAVLKACGLPASWKPKKAIARAKAGRSRKAA